jgi:hypothetical protein
MYKLLLFSLLVISCGNPMPPGKVGHMIMQLPDTVEIDSCERRAMDSFWGARGNGVHKIPACPLHEEKHKP